DEWYKLVQRLLFGKLSRREPAGQVKRAEFQREAPVQRVDVAREHRAELAALRINSKIYRTAGHRMFDGNCSGDRQWPQPCQPVRQIAETFAEENSGLEQLGGIGVDAFSPGMADAPSESR